MAKVYHKETILKLTLKIFKANFANEMNFKLGEANFTKDISHGPLSYSLTFLKGLMPSG